MGSIMTTGEIIQLLVGSGGLLAFLVVVFKMGKMAKTIESVEKSITELRSDMDHRFKDAKSDMNHRFAELKSDMDKRFEAVDRRFEAVEKKFEAVDKRFDTMDKKFEIIDRKLEALDDRFESMQYDIHGLAMQLGKLETRVEERTLRVVHADYDKTPAMG